MKNIKLQRLLDLVMRFRFVALAALCIGGAINDAWAATYGVQLISATGGGSLMNDAGDIVGVIQKPGTPMLCPYCYSSAIVKNGSNSAKTPKFRCKDCRRQFVENPIQSRITDAEKALIDKMLLEKIPLAGIARVTGISERWLQDYANDKYESVPRVVTVMAKTSFDLTIECDEAWSFVGNKANKQWIWLALDRETREVVGVHVGDRSAQGAQALWDSLPQVYREHARCYTDFWEAYQAIFPADRHRAVGKDSGKTNHIERFNCTLRQRVSRLVRKTLSFSKKLENHIGAIFYFIHHYNATLRARAQWA